MRTQWNDAEDGALQGLPMLARVLYLQGLRRHMDIATGLVGAARGISYQGLREVLFVEPVTGRQDSGSPSIKSVRVALGQLAKAGLVRPEGDRDKLVFRCLLADTGQSDQNKEGRPRADLGQTYCGTGFTGSNQGYTEQEGRPRADLGQTYQGNPLESGIREDSEAIASGAVAPAKDPKTAIWDLGQSYLGSRAMVGKLIKSYGEADVFLAIAQVATHNPADPKQYIHGILRNKGGNGGRKSKSEIAFALNIEDVFGCVGEHTAEERIVDGSVVLDPFD